MPTTNPNPAPHAAPVATPTLSAFNGEAYTVRRKVFKLFGAAFHLLDKSGNVIGYSKQKAFKLKEDIRVYKDESMQTELLTILARQVIDWGASYDVIDPRTGQPVGSLRRKGWTSTLVRDEWQIFSPDGREIGLVQEEGAFLAFLRRFVDWVAFLSPEKFNVLVGGVPVARLRQHFNPFVYKLSVAFTPNMAQHIDPRLVLASSILIAAIEGRQE
jgi:hypothetical protein